jgi:hypothetical protein
MDDTAPLVEDLKEAVSWPRDDRLAGSRLQERFGSSEPTTKRKTAEAIRSTLRAGIKRITGEHYLPGCGKISAQQIRDALSYLLGLAAGTEMASAPARRREASRALKLYISDKQWRDRGYDDELLRILAQELLEPALRAPGIEGPETRLRIDRQVTTIEITEYCERARSDTVLDITALVDNPGLLVFTETLGGLEAVVGAGLTEFDYLPRGSRDDTATVMGRLPSMRAKESCTVSWTTTRLLRRTPERVYQAYGEVNVMAAYELPLLVLTLRFTELTEGSSSRRNKFPLRVQYYEHYELNPGDFGVGVVQKADLRGPVPPSADGTTYTRQFRDVKKLHHYGMTWFY